MRQQLSAALAARRRSDAVRGLRRKTTSVRSHRAEEDNAPTATCGRLAILLGDEGAGLPQKTHRCRRVMTIPCATVESINVAMAAP